MPIGSNTSPADLNKRIDFQAQTKVPDNMGGFTVVWASMASSIAAAIWPVSASEAIQGSRPVMDITHRIRIRYRANLKASWRISWAGKYFNIVSIIDPNSAHRWLDILAKEAA